MKPLISCFKPCTVSSIREHQEMAKEKSEPGNTVVLYTVQKVGQFIAQCLGTKKLRKQNNKQ